MNKADFKKKDPFEALDDEFKAAINSSKPDDIKRLVATVALDQATLMNAKENDLDLKEKAEIHKNAGEVYREGTKANKLKIKFARSVLEGMGKL